MGYADREDFLNPGVYWEAKGSFYCFYVHGGSRALVEAKEWDCSCSYRLGTLLRGLLSEFLSSLGSREKKKKSFRISSRVIFLSVIMYPSSLSSLSLHPTWLLLEPRRPDNFLRVRSDIYDRVAMYQSTIYAGALERAHLAKKLFSARFWQAGGYRFLTDEEETNTSSGSCWWATPVCSSCTVTTNHYLLLLFLVLVLFATIIVDGMATAHVIGCLMCGIIVGQHETMLVIVLKSSIDILPENVSTS